MCLSLQILFKRKVSPSPDEKSKNLSISEQSKLLVVDLHLSAAIFWQEHLVAFLDAHRNDVSLRGLRPWTNGDDRPFVHLFAERRSQTKRGELVAKVERSAPRER